MSRLMCLCAWICALVCACSQSGSAGSDEGGPLGHDGTSAADARGVLPPAGDAGGITPLDGGRVIDSGVDAACQIGAQKCAGSTAIRRCQTVDGQPAWVELSCPTHSYCLADATGCQPGCLDECTLGATRQVGGKTETCALYSTATQGFIDPDPSTMEDRARLHDGWTRRFNLADGIVTNVRFTDTSYKKVSVHVGVADSAIWTGAYLAAQALRLEATGAPDARASTERAVETIHDLFRVTGHPGYMARFLAPFGQPETDVLFEQRSDMHQCTFDGQPSWWYGNTSRDQYQGMLLGYSLAYDALTSEAHREMIRDDIVALATELIKVRKQVPVTIRFKLGGWQQLTFNYDLQYVVLNPSEYVDGGPFAQIGSDADSSDYGDSKLVGMREFFPDYATMLKQTPLIGPLIPSIPRAGSVIMLANILRIALQVTEGVAEHQAARAAIEAHYQANIGKWLPMMKAYVYLNQEKCWDSYFALNIVYMPLYNLIRLEPSASIRSALQTDVLGARLWSLVSEHKNTFFAYLTEGCAPGTLSQSEIDAFNSQLDQFPPPPYASIGIDNRGRYPASSECENQSSVAIDVADRTRSDFIWQRQPFSLVKAADPTHVYPAVDYLLAYWLGRADGHLVDDQQACLRWQK